MKRSIKTILIAVLSVISATFFLVGCDSCADKKGELKSMFAEEKSEYVLSDNYAFGEDDVKATDGKDKTVSIKKPLTVNLNGHELDLNGYTFDIGFNDKANVVFKDGTIKNGILTITVPNGDIDFEKTTLADNVQYDLHAASETIRFSNAKMYGKGVIKSNTRVQIEYSSVNDITLSGNANLIAKSGTKLGSLTVAESAKGAKVEVDRLAEVKAVEIKAPISAEVKGKVSALTVAENVNAVSEDTFDIRISESATINKVDLKSAASVDVQGTVANLSIASTVKADETKSFEITIKENAKVSDLSISAKTKIEIKANVSNVVIEESATGSEVNFVGEAKVVNSVKIKAESVKVEAEQEVEVVVLDTVETVDLGETITKTEVSAEEMTTIIQEQHTCIWTLISEIEAGCETAGEKNEKCEICGKEKKTAISATGHDYECISRTEPVGGSDGEATFKCKNCGNVIKEKISAQFVFKGLDTIAELLGDGSYTIELDNIITVQNSDFQGTNDVALKIRNASIVLNSKNGHLTGSLEFTVNFDRSSKYDGSYNNEYSDKKEITVKGKLDGDAVTLYYVDNGNEHFGYLPVGTIIKELIKQALPGNGAISEMPSAMETALEKISEKLAGKIQNPKLTVSELNVIKMLCADEKVGANTKYTLSIDSINATGEMTVEQFVDAVFGNEKEKTIYKQLRDLITASLDKKATDAVLDVVSFAIENNLTEEDLKAVVEILQDVIAQVTGNEQTDIVSIFNQMKDMTVAEILVQSIGNDEHRPTVEEIKQAIEQKLLQCDEIVKITIADCLENFGVNGYLSIVGSLLEYVDLSFTLNAENKLVDYEIGYKMGEIVEENNDGAQWIYAKLSQVVGEKPQIELNVDFMGVKAYLEKIEKGDKLTVKYNGIQIDVSATETEKGYQLAVEGKNGDVISSEIAAQNIAATVDIEKLENGYKITDVLTIKADDYEVKQNAAITFEKGDAKPLLVEVPVIDFSGMKDFEIVSNDKYSKKVLKMQYVADDNGGHYELTEISESVDLYGKDFEADERADGKEVYRGCYRISESKAIIDEFNGLPAILMLADTDCKDCYKVSLLASDVICDDTCYDDVDFIINDDDTFEITEIFNENDAHTDTDNRGNVTFNVYYNVSDNTVQFNSYHDIKKSYKLSDGAKSCADGVEVTEACTKCDYKKVYTTTSCDYAEQEVYEFITQCNNSEYIARLVCCACGSEKLESSLSYGGNHACWGENGYYRKYTILSHREYTKKYEDNKKRYLDDGYSEEQSIDYAKRAMQEGYTDVATLTDIGDFTGFYYGEMNGYFCAECGIKWVEYLWYTSDGTADNCKKHNAITVEYNGNDGYDAFKTETPVSATAYGHYYQTERKTNGDIADGIKKEAFDLLPENLRFTYDKVAMEESKCAGCNLVSSRRIVFATEDEQGVSYKVAYISIGYKNGKISTYGYRVDLYDLNAAKTVAEKSGIDVSSYVSGYGSVTYLCGGYYSYDSYWYADGFRINTPSYYDKDGRDINNRLLVNVNLDKKGKTTYVNATYYDYDNCKQISYYVNSNGRVSKSENEWHAYTMEVYGTPNGSCINGYSVEKRCIRCGKVDYEYTSHNHRYYSYINGNVSGYLQYLTDDATALSGLDALINGEYCSYCGTAINCSVYLQSDWTLTQDVLIKAEGLSIYVNGHTIDLNGHTLKLYSENGNDLVLSDNEYDTSAKDPKVAVTDSQKDTENAGLLVLFNSSENQDYPEEYLEYVRYMQSINEPVMPFEFWCQEYGYDLPSDGEIIIGCIVIDCNYFLSDSDDLTTIDASIKEAYKNGTIISGYEPAPEEPEIDYDDKRLLALYEVISSSEVDYDEFYNTMVPGLIEGYDSYCEETEEPLSFDDWFTQKVGEILNNFNNDDIDDNSNTVEGKQDDSENVA